MGAISRGWPTRLDQHRVKTNGAHSFLPMPRHLRLPGPSYRRVQAKNHFESQDSGCRPRPLDVRGGTGSPERTGGGQRGCHGNPAGKDRAHVGLEWTAVKSLACI